MKINWKKIVRAVVSAWCGLSVLAGIMLIEEASWWVMAIVLSSALVSGLATKKVFEDCGKSI